jgi:hypothetical protein
VPLWPSFPSSTIAVTRNLRLAGLHSAIRGGYLAPDRRLGAQRSVWIVAC